MTIDYFVEKAKYTAYIGKNVSGTPSEENEITV